MKKLALSLLALVGAGSLSFAATNGTWTASGGANPGTDGWTQDLSGTGGWFQGDSNAVPGNPAWGFWSDSGGTSAGKWSLAGGALNVGQTVGIQFKNGSVNSGGVGVQFWNNTTLALAVFLNNGGPGYEIANSTGNVNSGMAWTNAGFTINATLTSSGSYNLSFLSYNGSGTLAGSQTTFDTIRVYSWDPTSSGSGSAFDVYANNVTVVPEPATWALLAGGLTTLMVLRRRRIS